MSSHFRALADYFPINTTISIKRVDIFSGRFTMVNLPGSKFRVEKIQGLNTGYFAAVQSLYTSYLFRLLSNF
jgi:hypothetical protein